ncbi:MAG: 3-deoxy-D-manno-octulosonic acid transferase [Rhodobacteraceae bacterium]|nr:3-deoxy-D-manno-octulosonic acid transferase [Paracoccaceae bacterium]MCW9043381.1 3-deoxy-D-manno-octulosonic acid transferase [Pseudopelagicola sp.]
MPRSLGLSAYLAFARRLPSRRMAPSAPRPDDELLWLHCPDAVSARAVAHLGQRLAAQRPGLALLLTTSPGTKRPKDLPEALFWQECPSENPEDTRQFLDHWRPDAGLWIGPYLRPSLIDASARRGIPVTLFDTGELLLENRLWRLGPDPIRPTLGLFQSILASETDAISRLRKLIPETVHLYKSGPLLEECPALACNETDLEDISQALGGRPTWLAARLQRSELSPVLAAHRAMLRLSHRLLLIVVPADPADAEAFHTTCRESGWRVSNWDDGDFPDDKSRIILSGDPRELGLWYRVAPVTFLGTSLTPKQGGQNPLEPAALGSAVLYGPSIRNHLDAYSRLAEAGAARIVRDVDSLINALGQVLAPDIAARMAHAGWEIVSEGAEVSDQIIALLQETLDTSEANA